MNTVHIEYSVNRVRAPKTETLNTRLFYKKVVYKKVVLGCSKS